MDLNRLHRDSEFAWRIPVQAPMNVPGVLYGDREQILQIIGTDLSGYVLEDAAIDYLDKHIEALEKDLKNVPEQKEAVKLLKTILPEVILATPFPKSMRWADLSIQFARPIQSIVALYGSKVVSFSLGGRETGRRSVGQKG